MPKTNTNYQNRLQLRISDKLLMAIENARRLEGAKKGFGVVPSRTEFIRYALIYTIATQNPELFETLSDLPEFIENRL